MASQSFRFLHSGQFELFRPLEGLTDAPPHLRERLVHAAYLAVERVVDTAIGETVDFAVLHGDLARCQAGGPRAAAFLATQFSRLEAHGIPVYWAAGDHDVRWPPALRLPDNIHVFAEGRVQEFVAERDGQALAAVQGCSGSKGGRLSEFRKSFTHPYTIAVLNGLYSAEQLADALIDYWALGGLPQEQTLFSRPRCAHYPGSPQGRSPQEVGAHGCTVVRVGEDGRAQLQRVSTDVVRWRQETVTILAGASAKDMEKKLVERARQLRDDASSLPMLVSWLIDGDGTALQWTRGGSGQHELVNRLRQDFGGEDSGIWTVSVDVELPEALPEHWSEEHTLLGQFVDELRAYRLQADDDLGVLAMLPDRPEAATLRQLLERTSAEDRQNVLRRTAVLGAALLRGERDAT